MAVGASRIDFDAAAVARSAVSGASVALPLQVLLRLADVGGSSGWWLLATVVTIFSFALAGYGAGRRRPDSPLAHGALAGAATYVVVAVVVVLVASLADDDATGSGDLVGRIFFGLLVASTVGMLGGRFGARVTGTMRP